MRIAVASTDGKVINQHFGKATRFLIFDIDDANVITFIESRETPAVCGSSESGHGEDVLEKVISILKDCKAVLCSRIGGGSARVLIDSGIEPVEAPYFIKDAIELYVKQYKSHSNQIAFRR